jgi:hypothetical protein
VPPLSFTGDAAASTATVLSAVPEGNWTPGEASDLSATNGSFIKAVGAAGIERLVRAGEKTGRRDIISASNNRTADLRDRTKKTSPGSPGRPTGARR